MRLPEIWTTHTAEDEWHALEQFAIASLFYDGEYEIDRLHPAEIAQHGLDASLRIWYAITDDDRILVCRIYETDDGWAIEEEK